MIEISKNTAYSDTMLGKKPFTTLDGKNRIHIPTLRQWQLVSQLVSLRTVS